MEAIRRRSMPFLGLLTLSLTLALPGKVVQAGGQDAAAGNAKTWIGHAKEYEDYLRTAEMVKVEKLGTGVTNPSRAHLAPGGPFESMAWKPLKPGMYRGFYESYKSEIAAYEIDKLLGLDMVPPTVERQYQGETGSAVMWCSPTKSFKELGGPPAADPAHMGMWNLQIVRAKMFDNLVGNMDPNLGNWLKDDVWNLVLIDHSRALTDGYKNLTHEMTRIDGALWEKMKALNESALSSAAGQWLDQKRIKALLDRRDKMAVAIDKLITAKGEAAVVMR